MKQIWTIANFTFIDICKSKILINVFGLGLGIVFFVWVATEFTYGVPERIAIDLGLGLASLSTLAIALFLGTQLISKEVEQRTLYMILSRPIQRYHFINGKILGLSFVLFINLFILYVLSLLIFAFLGGEVQPLILYAALYMYLEAILVLFIAVLFSLFTNTIITTLITLSFYIFGSAQGDILSFSMVKSNIFVYYSVKALSYILPHFHVLNLKPFILYKKTLEADILIHNLLYVAIYLSTLLVITNFIFKRKDLV